jgi:hypothetical protein
LTSAVENKLSVSVAPTVPAQRRTQTEAIATGRLSEMVAIRSKAERLQT